MQVVMLHLTFWMFTMALYSRTAEGGKVVRDLLDEVKIALIYFEYVF